MGVDNGFDEGVGDTFDDYFERELSAAPERLTSDLYHYTSSDAAILGILANRSIRLSPFQGTNDLWESRAIFPNLEGDVEDSDSFREDAFSVWQDVDRFIRGYSKVACFTQDWDLPESVMHREALRGWAHLSLWAHYGGRHSGVCLRFDKDRLISAFESAQLTAIQQFHGAVHYRRAENGVGPHGISLEQAQEFGVDAVALRYAHTHSGRMFFRKHADWASESEYRLVRTDLSTEPYYLDISDALTGVILGDEFPNDRIPALEKMLEGFDGVSIFQVKFHNRSIWLLPRGDDNGVETDPGETPIVESFIKPRRGGDLEERLSLLKEAELAAEADRQVAVAFAAPVCQAWQESLFGRPDLFTFWPNMIVGNWGSSTSAIPYGQRKKRPGVPGDRIAYEAGLGIIAEQDPTYSYTWVASIAFQLNANGSGVVHASITGEEWVDSGNKQQDLYRTQRCFNRHDFASIATEELDKLIEHIPQARLKFDSLRGVS